MEKAERSRVLIVEDEEAYVDALTIGLTREGFDIAVARTGAEALVQFDESDPDIVLLDLMLPAVSGLDVCRELRRRSTVPIIMVTAKSAEVDTVVGLEVGADDYVTKPYRIRELVARIRALLRREELIRAEVDRSTPLDGATDTVAEEAITVGDISLDVAKHEVVIRGEEVSLPLKEFELLHYLMANVGRVLTRDALIDRVWGFDYVGDTKTLDVHIKRLRAKVEVEPSRPVLIVTIRGLGYKFDRKR